MTYTGIDTAEKKPFRNEKFKDLNCQGKKFL